MVELTTTRNALGEATKQRLAAELSTIVLELEAAPFADFGDDPHMQAMSWCFVNEQDVFLGGRVHEKPIYRVTVTIPDGAPGVFGPLAGRNRRKLVERVTAAVLDAEGTENTAVEAHRAPGPLAHDRQRALGSFGEIVTLPEITKYGLKNDEPESKTARLREAALESIKASTGPASRAEVVGSIE